MDRRTTVALMTVVLIALCLGALAEEYHVNWDGTGDFTVIQDAINAAQNGDTVVVYPGTYLENIHFDGKSIILRSRDPEDEQVVASTIIDGQQNGSVVTFAGNENETCLLSGFTIKNGCNENGGGILGGEPWSAAALSGISHCTITGNSTPGDYTSGGGLSCCDGTISNCTISENSASVGGGLSYCGGTISHCTIISNSADNGGGLLYCDGTISNCAITDNSADDGGGMSECGGAINNCTITSNSAQGGGGLSCCDGTISNCTISGNSADHGGGLAWCDGAISNCIISDNSAQNIGGGLSTCHGTISECTISGNSAPSVGGLDSCGGVIENCTISGNDGGGLYYCDGPISNCTITGNAVTGEYARGGGLDFCSGVINNCTITGNSAEYGGGLHQCYATVTDCIIWGNDAPNGGDLWDCGGTTITYSCVGVWFGGGEGNISEDPLFVSGPLGDCYLSSVAAGQAADSPCIDAGGDTAESLGLDRLTTRTDHVPDSGAVDMGYHYPLTQQQDPYIQSSLNASEFSPGDTLVGLIEAHNPGADVIVDAYVAFVLPDGAMISLRAGGLATGIYPWVSNVMLPSGFAFGPSEVIQAAVPQSPGDYLFACALTKPGVFEFIGEPSVSAFNLVED